MTVITDRAWLLRMENYPGMIPAESRVLRQFIHHQGGRFDEFRFNVRIGDGVTTTEDVDPKLAAAWEQITKARPDSVAFKHPNDATIVEVKEAFTNEAVWQLLAYRDLYVKAFPDHTVRLAGVAQLATPTARILAAAQGIALFLYKFPPGTVDTREIAAETTP